MFSPKVVAVTAVGLIVGLALLYLPKKPASSLIPQEAPVAFFHEEKVIAGGPKDSLEVRHLVLKGTNLEIGQHLAKIAKERFQVQPQPGQDPLRTRSQRQYIEKNFTILHERMRGVASAFGKPLTDDSWNFSGLDFTALRAGCSVVHMPPGSMAKGVSLVSRDYDYTTGSMTFGTLEPGRLHPTARPYLIELHPDQGYASLAMVSYDLLSGVLDGINSEGLTVTLAMDEEIMQKTPIEPNTVSPVGLGVLQMLRLLLDTCATADEAKQALLQTKQYYEYVPVHFLIADRFGKSFVWEYAKEHNKEFIIENPDQPLVMTNFSLNTHLDKTKPPTAFQAANVCKRYCLLADELIGASGKCTEEFIKQTHKKVDAALPAADPSRPPVRTFWHALYFPEERRMQINYYLRDEVDPAHPERPGIIRSDYQEFRLTPTNHGTAPLSDSASSKSERAAPTEKPGESSQKPKTEKAIAELKKGGATVRSVSGRVLAVDLSKAASLGPLLPLLRDLPDLEELQIQNQKFDDAAFAKLESLPKLARLGIQSGAVSDEGLKALKALPHLKTLLVGKSQISDAGLVHLTNLTHLEQLGLRGNRISGPGLVHLAQLTTLTRLDLSETAISDAALAHLRPLSKLEILILTNDAITDAGLAHLARLTNVTALFLGSTKVTDAGLVHLKGMSKLTKLNLANTGVTDEGVAKAKPFLPGWITIQREKK